MSSVSALTLQPQRPCCLIMPTGCPCRPVLSCLQHRAEACAEKRRENSSVQLYGFIGGGFCRHHGQPVGKIILLRDLVLQFDAVYIHMSQKCQIKAPNVFMMKSLLHQLLTKCFPHGLLVLTSCGFYCMPQVSRQIHS